MSSRMRATRSKTRQRRSHHALKKVQLSVCENCSAEHLRHHACEQCGMYRGREVINVLRDVEKKIQNAEKKGEKASQNSEAGD